MANIKLKRSAIQNKVPLTGDLALGEMALNTYDGRIYTKKEFDAIIDVSYDLDYAYYAGAGNTFNPVTQTSSTLGLDISADGLNMYILGGSEDTVFQYNLSIAYDVNSASYSSQSKLISAEATIPTGMILSLDGTKMYVVDLSTVNVFQYTLSTPWDVSTATYATKLFLFTGQTTNIRSIRFSSDGGTMYACERYAGNNVYQYTLGTPWDVSTAVYANKLKDFSAQTTSAQGVEFNADESKMYICSAVEGRIYEYDLLTPGDVSTATVNDASRSTIKEILQHQLQEMFFVPGGNKFIICGQTQGVFQYDLDVHAISSYATEECGDFDGTNDYMNRGAGLTGVVDGKKGMASLWVKYDSTANNADLLQTHGPGVDIYHLASNKNTVISLVAPDLSLVMQCVGSITTDVADGWVHLLVAWDTGTGYIEFYINDVLATANITINSTKDIDYTHTDFWISRAALNTGSKLNGSIAEIYLNTTELLDITIEANRRKFIDASGFPVDLGVSGQFPTGTSPIICLKNPYGTFQNNLGTGGDFIVTGAIDTTFDRPSDVFAPTSASLLKDTDVVDLSNPIKNISVIDPTVTDDADFSYSAGDQWYNSVTKKIFSCVDNALGAAVWAEITVAAVAPSTNADTLDTLDSTQFLRSDVVDQVDAVITYDANPVFNNAKYISAKNSTAELTRIMGIAADNNLYIGQLDTLTADINNIVFQIDNTDIATFNLSTGVAIAGALSVVGNTLTVQNGLWGQLSTSMYIGSIGQGGMMFNGVNVEPTNGSGSTRANGTNSLGSTNYRWNKLHTNSILFGGDTAANNELDDYEEGDFIPLWTFGGASVDLTHVTQAGRFTKTGNRVTITGYIQVNALGTSTGTVEIFGLPYASANIGSLAYCSVALRLNGFTGFTQMAQAFISANSTKFTLSYLNNGVVAALTNAHCAAANSSIIFNATYEAA